MKHIEICGKTPSYELQQTPDFFVPTTAESDAASLPTMVTDVALSLPLSPSDMHISIPTEIEGIISSFNFQFSPASSTPEECLVHEDEVVSESSASKSYHADYMQSQKVSWY